MSEGAIAFGYNGSPAEWMRDRIRKMRQLEFNAVRWGPDSLDCIRFGNLDAGLADSIYREAGIPYAIHVPLIKPPVELKPGAARPDAFGASYKRHVREEVAKRVEPNKDNPWGLLFCTLIRAEVAFFDRVAP